MKKTLLTIIFLITASAFLFYSKKETRIIIEEPKKLETAEIILANRTEPIVSETNKEEPAPEPIATSTETTTTTTTKTEIETGTKTTEINLDVPFSSQAPFSDWAEPYQNACEETASLMVAKYYQKATLTPAIAKQEILDLVAWENKNFSYYEDTTAQETAQILQDYYGFKRVDVIYDFSLDDLKAQILAGRPIIIPASGQMLKNPNFKQPGPIYHMLVIKGITKTGDFITNDNGTRKGHNYIYNPDILYAAIHDAPQGGHSINKADLDSNRKAMIVVYPN